MTNQMRQIALMCFLTALLAVQSRQAVQAQQARQVNFSGKLLDTRHNPVGGASVHLLNTNRTVVSNEAGVFHIDRLPPGRYLMEVTAVGYEKIDSSVVLGAGNNDKTEDFLLVRKTGSLEDIVVTAEKREELLRQVPISVTALTARQVEDYRLWENRDLTAVVPNLYAADAGDGRDVISIRGITTTSYDPAVGIYLDGVSQFGLDTYIPALFDVERIEVLRGPQGTLYGRNAMGGVINIITREPGNIADGFAEASVGNDGIQRYSAGFRAPLIKDKLFIGVAGLYDGRNGFYTNQFNNQSYDRQHSFTGNYYLRYIASPRWQFDLNVKQRYNRNHGAFPLVSGAAQALQDPFVLDQNATTVMVDNTMNASLAVRYSGPAFNFTSQTAYEDNYRYYTQPIDGDFSPLDAVTIINNYGKPWNDVKVATQEFKFTSPASSTSRWKWTAGAYGFLQDAPNKQATRYGQDANLIGAGDSLFTTLSTTKSHKYGMALYGQATYALTGRLNATAGLRYDYEHQKEDVLGQYQHDPSPDLVTTIPDTSGGVSFGALSPKLGLDYTLSRHAMLYAVYSRGFRTGGLTELSFDPTQPPLVGFKPEYSDNYEVGIKGSVLDNVLRLDADVFYSHVSDAQVPTLILPEAITVTRNTGRLNNSGVEATVSASPLRNLTVDYNFGYTHSRYERLELSQDAGVTDLAGKRQVFTPDMTSMLAVQYVHPFGTGTRHPLKGFIRGEWKSIGTTWYDLNNTIGQSPYNLFNGSLGVSTSNVEVTLWARNMGDEKYISYGYDFGAVHLGDPRTYGITLRILTFNFHHFSDK
jgi:iron complex outermembrane receptor protein